METRKIRVEITQAHLDECLYDDFDLNPISLSIKDVFGRYCKLRGVSKTLSLWNAKAPAAVMTDEICDLYELHLRGELGPTSFELEAPIEWFGKSPDENT